MLLCSETLVPLIGFHSFARMEESDTPGMLQGVRYTGATLALGFTALPMLLCCY